MNTSIENDRSRYVMWTLLTGVVLGIACVLLLRLGKPPNMGLCGACFLRDVSGGMMLFSKPAGLQYLRPEIPGFIVGAAFCHNFGLAAKPASEASAGGPSPAGMIAVVIGIVICLGLGFLCSARSSNLDAH